MKRTVHEGFGGGRIPFGGVHTFLGGVHTVRRYVRRCGILCYVVLLLLPVSNAVLPSALSNAVLPSALSDAVLPSALQARPIDALHCTSIAIYSIWNPPTIRLQT